MSYHSERYGGPTPTVRHQVLYTLAMRVHRPGSSRPDSLASRLMIFIGSICLTNGHCQPRQIALGRECGRSDRSVRRSLKALLDAGLITKRRRGKQLSNVYRLSKALWRRLTNDLAHKPRRSHRASPVQLSIPQYMAGLRAKWEASRARGIPVPA